MPKNIMEWEPAGLAVGFSLTIWERARIALVGAWVPRPVPRLNHIPMFDTLMPAA